MCLIDCGCGVIGLKEALSGRRLDCRCVHAGVGSVSRIERQQLAVAKGNVASRQGASTDTGVSDTGFDAGGDAELRELDAALG